MRIIQITDTHLSPSKTHFHSNWQPLADWIAGEKPELVIHTGDLSVDGAGTEEDLAYSVKLLNALPVSVLSVPGNHDIGHMHDEAQPVDAERLERWRRLVGPEFWFQDTDNWRLIGLNSLVFGMDNAEEGEQFAWLADTLASAAGRRIAIFAHKPLFVDMPEEGDTGYWGVRPMARQKLLDLFDRYDIAMHASGHLHRAWTGRLRDTSLVWAPASSFIVGDMEREMPGERILGAAVHTFADDIQTEIVEIAELSPFVLDDVVEEVYPRARPEVKEAAV
ncbi:metallophosphoesterase [Paramesorhizobium deserti]|uniref:Metallophosphoesterase n=1 Tax=Paramesorhizobium deserti TaxID=1494590 RepID=A0A135HQ32_9HYPH|nr:metallophosphoesterase [Paramesorhizobium deserti]KXF75305.1 metallophosphoesterase [Paramesorhizobium deserti]